MLADQRDLLIGHRLRFVAEQLATARDRDRLRDVLRTFDELHGLAQYNIALGYRDGLGVPRSQRIAVKWLRVSAAAGNADAQNDLGYCLHEGLGVGG